MLFLRPLFHFVIYTCFSFYEKIDQRVSFISILQKNNLIKNLDIYKRTKVYTISLCISTLDLLYPVMYKFLPAFALLIAIARLIIS